MATIVSFCFPHFVVVRALRQLSVLLDFSFVILECSQKERLGSSVRPSTLGFLIVGIFWLFIVNASVLFCSVRVAVNSVDDDLVGFS